MNYRMMTYILGNIMQAEGALMSFSVLLALYQAEWNELKVFLLTIALLLGLGTLAKRSAPKDKKIYGREGFVVVALSWIVMSFFGALPFWLSGAIDGFINCWFETVSGFTTTGATVLSEIESLPKSILFWRSFTHWIGGMGILVFVLAIVPLGDERSMHLMRAEAPGPVVSKLVPKIKSTAKILYGIYIALTILEGLLLFIGGMPLFDSINHALSTAGTGGFSIKNSSIAAYDNAYFEYVITIFMLLFSINFNLFYLLLVRDFKAVLKNEELRYYLIIVGLSTLMITMNILHLYPTAESAFRHAFFQVATITSTTGFFTANYEQWPELSKTILVVLTMLGACGGSTGGGIKVSRFIILLKLTLREISHIVHPRSVNIIRLEGQRISEETIQGTTGYFITYVLLLFGSLILVSFDNYDFTTSITAVITTLGNVGPGLSLVGPVENFGLFSGFAKLVLSMDMLFGRLEIFPMIMLFSPSIWKKSYM